MNGNNQYWQYQPPRQPPGGVYYPQPSRRRSTARLWWFLGAAFVVTVSGPKDEKLAHVPPPQRWRHRTEQMAERLRAGEQWQDRGLVLTTELGSPIDPRNLLRVVENAARAAGCDGVGGAHPAARCGGGLAGGGRAHQGRRRYARALVERHHGRRLRAHQRRHRQGRGNDGCHRTSLRP